MGEAGSRSASLIFFMDERIWFPRAPIVDIGVTTVDGLRLFRGLVLVGEGVAKG